MAITLSHNKHTARASSRACVARFVAARRCPARPSVRASSSPGPSKHITVQVVDDLVGKTLASASTMESDLRSFDGDKTAKAKKVGELVAERAKTAGVDGVVFDRAGNKYHGRIAALADGAREGGLTF